MLTRSQTTREILNLIMKILRFEIILHRLLDPMAIRRSLKRVICHNVDRCRVTDFGKYSVGIN